MVSADAVLLSPKGSELTLDWFSSHGFDKPMIIKSPEGLKIKVPPSDFTIADVERYVGEWAVGHLCVLINEQVP